MWLRTIARLSFCTPSKASASTKSPLSPASRRTAYCTRFLPRATTCANHPSLSVNSRGGSRPRGPRRSNSLGKEVGQRMITREQIQELAQFEDPAACALSFYYQPTAPRNKAHKEEAILTKDLAREALRQFESKNTSKDSCESARADLDRIVRLSRDLSSHGARAKA